MQELEHSARGAFFRKIGNFSTFSTNSKIPKIYLSGPITVQSFCIKYCLKKEALKQRDFEQNIPTFRLKFEFYRKIFRFSTFFKICKKWRIGALRCTKFQQNPARNFRSGNFSDFFHFGNFFFLQNCKNWNILQRELFSEKSEIFPLFPLTRKFRKFIYPGL